MKIKSNLESVPKTKKKAASLSCPKTKKIILIKGCQEAFS